MKELEIIYEDKDVLVIRKPAGVPVQSARVGAKDCESLLKNYLYRKNPKGGAPYLGLIHRLDQPVEGLVVFALNPKAAAALSKQSAGKEMQKTYLAVRHSVDKCPHPVPNEEKFCGKPVDNVEKYVDYLLKDEKENTSRIVDMGIKGGKRAELICRVLESKTVEPYGELTLAEIELLTGRHHQIRVQMSGHGLPLWGDNRYNPAFCRGDQAAGTIAAENADSPAGGFDRRRALSGRRSAAQAGADRIAVRRPRAHRADIALAAYELRFTHPVTGKIMTFRQNPSGGIFRQFAIGQEHV